MNSTATPNHALQRTAPGRHACCSRQSPPCSSHAVPPQSLSFGALGVATRIASLVLAVMPVFGVVAGEPASPVSLPAKVQQASHIFVATAKSVTSVKEARGLTVRAKLDIHEVLIPERWHPPKAYEVEFHFRNQDPAVLRTDLVGHEMIYILMQPWNGSSTFTGAADGFQVAFPLTRRSEIEAELTKLNSAKSK